MSIDKKIKKHYTAMGEDEPENAVLIESSDADQKVDQKKRKRNAETPSDDNTKILSKAEKKELKKRKKEEKQALLSKVPKMDKDGIAYTKIQIKRMLKRVTRGLEPVPTEEEEREILRARKAEERETELEMADMLFRKEELESADVEGDLDDQSGDENMSGDVLVDDNEEGSNGKDVSLDARSPFKKKARSKPVPEDYVCSACNNIHSPAHWIYDCPDKLYQPGTNHKKKSLRGIHESSAKKVFVSGLPFDATTKSVTNYFENDLKCGKVEHCKLLIFEDTKRCKGQGFITFETEIAASKALKLNGIVMNMETNSDKAKNKNSNKELKLGVKKVVTRAITKGFNKNKK